MRQKIISLALALFLSSNSLLTGVSASSQEGIKLNKSYLKQNVLETFSKNKTKNNYKKDQILVKYKENASVSSINETIKGKYIKSAKKLKKNVSLISFDSSKSTVEEQLKLMNENSAVECAEPDYVSKIADTPSDPYFGLEWGLKNENSNIDTNVLPAWNITKGNPQVVVGVLDTGIDLGHPDLQNCIWTNTLEIAGNGIDDDGNGYIDDVNGWDFVGNGDNCPQDDNDHGTHVSGIIAAAHNNGTGIAGVAPNVKILPLKVGDSGGYIADSDVVAAIEYGDKEGVQIYNCSFGSYYYSYIEKEAMAASGALFICAAGNGDEYGIGEDNDITPTYPASFDLPNIISVAALDQNGRLTSFSNFGNSSVDIAAPGLDIVSTIRVADGSYDYMSGTSMAAPFVTGAAALIRSIGSLSSADIKAAILSSTHKLSSLSGKVSTGAILDIGGEITSINNSSNVSVTGVSLNKSSMKLVTGSFEKLIPDVEPVDATNKWVNWTSSNSAVAAVSDGIVTGKSAGSALITATTLDGSKTASCTVNVGLSPMPISKTYITENQTFANKTIYGDLYIGPEAVLMATGNVTVTGNVYVLGALVSYKGVLTVQGTVYANEFVDNVYSLYYGTVDRIYEDTLNDSYGGTSTNTQNINIPINIYGTNNKTIAVYGSTLNITGAVLPIADVYLDGQKINYYSNGTFETSVDVSNKTSINFTVTDVFGDSKNIKYDIVKTSTAGIIPVSGIKLSSGSSTIYKNAKLTLTAAVSPSNATIKDVSWASSNSNVASVDSNGNVYGVSAGTAVISAKTKEGEYEASCIVTVSGGYLITPVRLGGTTRFDTAAAVSRAGWTSSDNVVLVNGYGFADALTGVPFAYLKNAPVLLTAPGSLPSASYNEIVRLKAKNIYLLGGTGVINSSVESFLKSKGYIVNRIYGNTRFDTALAIGSQVVKAKGSKTAIVTTAYNYPDALAISSYAAMKGYPILYTEPSALNSKTKSFLINNGITSVIIPGGTGAVSSAAENNLKNIGITVTRISGASRYETALNIAKKYKSSFNCDTMISTGANFPDALAGGVLAAKKGIPILLVDNKNINTNVVNYIRSNGKTNLFVLGGTGVITDNTVNLIK